MSRACAAIGAFVLSVAIAGPVAPSRPSAQALRTPPIAGTWKVTLHDADDVDLDFRMTFVVSSPTPVKWEAYSRAGAAREMVSGGTAALGRLFGQMPPHEALVYIGSGTAVDRGETVVLEGALESPFLGNRKFTGVLAANRIDADLTRAASGTAAGTMRAVRDDGTAAYRDYAAVAEDLERAIREHIFNPAMLARREFQEFFTEIHARFGRATDDLDVIGSFQALKRSLGTSHFEFVRNPRMAARSLDEIVAGDQRVNPETFLRLGFPAPQVALLRITKWDRLDAVIDRAFERIETSNSRVLIVDIRGNPGGDATSMALLAHLIQTPVHVGNFLGRRWYEHHPGSPGAQDIAGMTTIDSRGRPMQLLADLREHGAVAAHVTPRAPHFSGSVYLLVDHATASASEPLAHVLKTSKLATVIGDRTAGHMLMALPVSLRDGWVATVPESDFIAADGTRIEGAGVEPNVKTAQSDVYLGVADQFDGTLPFSAAFVRGGSYDSLKRPADAERAYRAAISAANRQQPAPDALSLAAVHKRLAVILMAKGDRTAALREYSNVLKYAPNDAEALAAVRGGDAPPQVVPLPESRAVSMSLNNASIELARPA
jgi:hypothetical protein